MKTFIKAVCVAIAATLTITSSAQEHPANCCSQLFITFTQNDCINCSIGLTQLHTFPVELEKHLILRNCDQPFFEEYSRENFLFDQVQNLTINYSDSLYGKYQQNNLSTCNFIVDGSPIMVFPLTELLSRKPVIDMITHDFSEHNTDTIALDSLVLSGRISISRGDDHIFIYDYFLNKIAILDKSGLIAKSGTITILKPHISKVQLMEIAHLDTNAYKGTLPIFHALGKDKIRYEALYWSNDTLNTLLTFNYPQFKGKDTIIAMYLFLGRYVNNKLVSIRYIDDANFDNNYYNIDNTMPFYVTDSRMAFSMYVTSPKEETKLFSEWRETDDQQLVFDGYASPNLPEYFIRNKKEYDAYSAVLRDSLYYCTTYPFIYNIMDASQLDLSAEIERVEGVSLFGKTKTKKFFLQDVIENGSIIELLYFIDGTPKIAYYDKALEKISYSSNLSLGENLYLPSLVFLSPSVLMVLDDKRKNIILYK